MQEGAVTLSGEGVVLYCNQRFAELMARPPERIAGQPFRDFIDPENLPTLHRVLTTQSCRAEVQLRTGTDTSNPAQLSSIALNKRSATSIMTEVEVGEVDVTVLAPFRCRTRDARRLTGAAPASADRR